ncbi:MAG: hypothetical protein LC808_44625, partial [Actinobacteria bacterium]|nr:hypothetical protein [Actinomycetota bacterium]
MRAFTSLPQCCESTGLHGEETGFEFWLVWATQEVFVASTGELYGLLWLVKVMRQVTHTAEDVRAELTVAAHL